MFEVAMRMRMGDVNFENNEQCAEWLSSQLNQLGFEGGPIGMSWHTLYKKEKAKKSEKISINEPNRPE